MMTDPPFMRKMELMKKTLEAMYILECAYKRGERQRQRKEVRGGEEERRGRGEMKEGKEVGWSN